MTRSKPTLLLLALLASAAEAQVYEETQIRSWWYVMADGWNMTDTGSSTNWKFIPYYNHPVLDTHNIVGLNTYIYSDNHQESFNFTRQSGHAPGSNGHQYKSGGTSEAHMFCGEWDCANNLSFFWDRGDCPRSGGTVCTAPPPPEKGYDNFFFGDADPNVRSSLSFSSQGVNRGVVKVDYICPGACPTPTSHVLWQKLGAWDMTDAPAGREFDLASTHGITPTEVLDMQAAIHSDPGAGSLYGIVVDNFEHMGSRGSFWWGRGGILWYGKGCGHSQNCGLTANIANLKMWPGYIEQGMGEGTRGSYVGQFGGMGEARVYSSTAANRGWLKVEYTGTATSVPVPYAMKTRAVPLGFWNMQADLDKVLDLSQVGITTDRIAGLSVTIRSDFEECGLNCWPGWSFTNFHRTAHNSGTKIGGFSGAGGFVFVEDSIPGAAKIRLRQTDAANFYDSVAFNSTSVNRGYVKIDYLAGSCEEGPGSFTGQFRVQPLPGVYQRAGTCPSMSTGATFRIEGAGRGLEASAESDSLTYVNLSSYWGDRFTVIRVDSIANINGGGYAGLMGRYYGPDPKDPHVSLVVNGSNQVRFYTRQYWGDPNDLMDVESTSGLPVWLALKRDGSGEYTAMWMDATGSESEPPDPDDIGWNVLSSLVPSFGYGHQMGVVVYNAATKGMEKAKFSQFYEHWDP